MKKVPIKAIELVIGEKYHDTQHSNSIEFELVGRDEDGDPYFRPVDKNNYKGPYTAGSNGLICFASGDNSVWYKVEQDS